jgi:hypothetical protein
MSITTKNKQPKKEIDYDGQRPYNELPINMITFNGKKLGHYANIVFEGYEKNYKFIQIDSLNYYGNNEEWDPKMMTSEMILKRTLFLLYLKIWANTGDINKRAKNSVSEEKIDKYDLEYINRLNLRWNTTIVEELKIVLKKLLDKEVKRVYIVMVSYGDGEGIIISDNMKAKGYTEWTPEEKNKNLDLDKLATKFFSLKKIKNLREEGLVYIKQLEEKYNAQLENEKNKLPVVEVKTGGRKKIKRKIKN